ncbi:hypothetical protein [Pseudomonas phage LUZ7]|uniref:CMP/dCMP-type deaminase domain-containing protein n=1 Tax=Pseudomonas phage LUZ7 TaxID=655097 RepID=C8ZKD7_9CAUD|nr:hypothetical protein PP-LUZ7_gp043 [Pseudomonas phage LUZ7]CAZ66184.1 hypothetical protein [Pseudomonas phage LUZ7]
MVISYMNVAACGLPATLHEESSMAKKPEPRSMKYRDLYMSIARNAANQSVALRHKVGGVLVTRTGALFTGWNGTLPGSDNCCERGPWMDTEQRHRTTPHGVIHAEHNILAWASRSGVPLEGSHLWITRSPCIKCAEMLVTHGVTALFYEELHDDTTAFKVMQGSVKCFSWEAVNKSAQKHNVKWVTDEILKD